MHPSQSSFKTYHLEVNRLHVIVERRGRERLRFEEGFHLVGQDVPGLRGWVLLAKEVADPIVDHILLYMFEKLGDFVLHCAQAASPPEDLRCNSCDWVSTYEGS